MIAGAVILQGFPGLRSGSQHANTLGLMVRRRAQRAVSNHGSRFGLAAILRDALASLGLLRMRSEWWRDSQPLKMTTKLSVC
jgi:hypothetical protein